MNLVAKEYIASQNPDDPGVLVLSRFAGAAQECKEALLVNPYDPDSVAAALGQALAMSLAERRERFACTTPYFTSKLHLAALGAKLQLSPGSFPSNIPSTVRVMMPSAVLNPSSTSK